MTIHTERTFEEAIEHSLLAHGGYEEAPRDAFDPNLALLPSVLVSFLEETQPEKLARLHLNRAMDNGLTRQRRLRF